MRNKLVPIIVKIEKLRLRAIIGFNETERLKKQDVIISYAFTYLLLEGSSNNHDDFIDYKRINKRIISEIEASSHYLLEALAENIYQIIEDAGRVFDIVVEVHKPHAIRFSDSVSVRIEESSRMQIALIAIGSNINPQEAIAEAKRQLNKSFEIIFFAEPIWTKPIDIDGENQSDFLNSIALIKTDRYATDLKSTLKEIEKSCGRTFLEGARDPRRMDIDLVAFNGSVLESKNWSYPFFNELVRNSIPLGLFAGQVKNHIL